MGFFSAVKKIFGSDKSQAQDAPELAKKQEAENQGSVNQAPPSEEKQSKGELAAEPLAEQLSKQFAEAPAVQAAEPSAEPSGELSGKLSAAQAQALTVALRSVPPRLSVWLALVLDGKSGEITVHDLPRIEEAGNPLWQRLGFLLQALETPPEEGAAFVDDFRHWLARMDYHYLDDFRSELQYRLALALDLEDEEDERDRLFLKVQQGLSRTREQLGKGLASLMAGHTELTPIFWEELEELFIMADMGAEPALSLVKRLREKALTAQIQKPHELLPLLQAEVEAMFKVPRRIAAVNPPEVVLMVGVNGVGKTTTIAKLAHRERMQGKKVLIAAADTFRAAAVEQLAVWAERVGADFHSKPAGADPAAVAYEAMEKALEGKYDIVFIDTAGRLHTKANLMEELHKIQAVIAKKHQGAPHRTILVIDATTGQNALQQTKIFKESSKVNEIILTKLDGTAKGGVALAVATQFDIPITYIGLGEKMEDLRPFHAHDFAKALLGQAQESM